MSCNGFTFILILMATEAKWLVFGILFFFCFKKCSVESFVVRQRAPAGVVACFVATGKDYFGFTFFFHRNKFF